MHSCGESQQNWCENEALQVSLTNRVSIKWYAEFFTTTVAAGVLQIIGICKTNKTRTTEKQQQQLVLQTWNFSSITLPRSSQIGQLTPSSRGVVVLQGLPQNSLVDHETAKIGSVGHMIQNQRKFSDLLEKRRL